MRFRIHAHAIIQNIFLKRSRGEEVRKIFEAAWEGESNGILDWRMQA